MLCKQISLSMRTWHSLKMTVFGCELDLLHLHTQRPLPEAFHTVLLQRPKLQIVVRPCMVDGHSIWQFQADGRESYPKVLRVRANPRGEIADRVELVSVKKLMTVMSLHQGHSCADMHLRVVAHLHPSPLPGTTPINLERCLKAHSVEQALNSSVCQVTFTISGHGPVKTAKDLWRSTSRAQKSQPCSTPPLPTAWL